MNIPSSVGLGLVTFALFAWPLVAGGEDRGWIDDPAVLCSHGHPAKRLPTDYDGWQVRHGYQRDHVVPRELGGPDTTANLQYQRCYETGPHGRCLEGPAADKDKDEWAAGKAYCRHPSPELLDQLRRSFK